jgi:cell division protein ZapA (FtsZ GTPase activity inhibitor)
MAQLRFKIGNRPYEMACEDGQEQALQDAAALLDAEAQTILQGSGQLSEARLLLFSALIVADKYRALLASGANTTSANDLLQDILASLQEIRTLAEQVAK